MYSQRTTHHHRVYRTQNLTPAHQSADRQLTGRGPKWPVGRAQTATPPRHATASMASNAHQLVDVDSRRGHCHTRSRRQSVPRRGRTVACTLHAQALASRRAYLRSLPSRRPLGGREVANRPCHASSRHLYTSGAKPRRKQPLRRRQQCCRAAGAAPARTRVAPPCRPERVTHPASRTWIDEA